MNVAGIICGLGNPGPRYSSTRHNAGFMVIDRLIQWAAKIPEEQIRQKNETRDYILWEWARLYYPEKWLLLKPMTFMNRSGAALSKVLSKSMVDVDRLLIIHDEVDLSVGKIQIKSGGGLAGHKGLVSIANDLGTRDFVRLRFGVGRPELGLDLSRYVLERFLPGETQLWDQTLDMAVQVIGSFRDGGLGKARDKMSMLFNQPPQKEI